MGDLILKRKKYDELLEWKNRHAPDYALFIKGARRVGKTTLAEEFGSKEYKSFITINFQEAGDSVKDLFINSLLDLDYFFNVIQMQYNIRLYKRESLIILDEIQLFPKARQALKTLLKDGRYDYIETGSLAGIKKKTREEEILVPSEEHPLELFPLDFEEYLWSMGDTYTMDIIRNNYENVKPFDKLHKDILRRFREYMCVGGMPQAVRAYAGTHDFEKVDFAKKEILELYRNDIKEQKEENSDYVGNVLEHIPTELSRQGSRIYRLSHINQNARRREYKRPINWLEEAMIVNTARCVSEPSPALTLKYEDNKFKCYMMDTGLLINLSFGDGSFLDNDIYRAILTDKLHVNEGMFVENIVAQCLRTTGHKILFYSEYDKNGANVMEIDFLIRQGRKIVPIEVKSGKKYNTLSLKKFKTKFSDKVGVQLVLHEGDTRREGEVICFPYYVAALL